jgi:hypothetical protein
MNRADTVFLLQEDSILRLKAIQRLHGMSEETFRKIRTRTVAQVMMTRSILLFDFLNDLSSNSVFPLVQKSPFGKGRLSREILHLEDFRGFILDTIP